MKKLLVFIIACAISGCITGGSMEYRPLNAKEKEAFDKSDRTVFPDDVRQALDKYKETTVAWTGIIEEIRMIETEGYIERIILCRQLPECPPSIFLAAPSACRQSAW